MIIYLFLLFYYFLLYFIIICLSFSIFINVSMVPITQSLSSQAKSKLFKQAVGEIVILIVHELIVFLKITFLLILFIAMHSIRQHAINLFLASKSPQHYIPWYRILGLKPLSSSRKKYTLSFSITRSLLFHIGIRSFSETILVICLSATFFNTKSAAKYATAAAPTTPPAL